MFSDFLIFLGLARRVPQNNADLRDEGDVEGENHYKALGSVGHEREETS